MSTLRVLKFGGTSVATAESIERVVDIVKRAREEGSVAVVVSALGGVTNALLGAADAASRRDEARAQRLVEEGDDAVAVHEGPVQIEEGHPAGVPGRRVEDAGEVREERRGRRIGHGREKSEPSMKERPIIAAEGTDSDGAASLARHRPLPRSRERVARNA